MARRSDVKVQRDEVVQAALGVLDEVGLEALTMRRLADALKIQAPSLYWHFPDKQALLDGMADAIIGKVVLPKESKNWQTHLRAVASSMRKALVAHRDGARVYAGTYLQTDNIMRLSEAILAPLIKAGASPGLALDTLWAFFYYILAFAIEEQAAVRSEGLEVHIKKEPHISQEKYPCLAAIAPRAMDINLDARFDAGIALILTGVNAQVVRLTATKGK